MAKKQTPEPEAEAQDETPTQNAYPVASPLPPITNLYASFLCAGLLATGKPQGQLVVGMTVDPTANTAPGPPIRRPVDAPPAIEQPPEDKPNDAQPQG